MDRVDFVFVTGDAYVDHPSFAAALLGRLLEANGYSVGILAQPDWHDAESFKALGEPRLAFLVSAGAMDSMVSNYTANNKPRSQDAYSHGGMAGHRPDRAIIRYVAKIREAYKGVGVIIGGIEASLRRTAHYDYWSDTVRRSVLLDSKADLLMYGMGERSMLEIARRLREGEGVRDIRDMRGTCWYTGKAQELPPYESALGERPADDDRSLGIPRGSALMLPGYTEISGQSPEGRELFARSYLVQERNTDPVSAHVLIEPSEERYVVQMPPALPLTTEEFDSIYDLPFTRRWHPMYDVPAANGKTGVPALSEVKFSLTSSRGCFGACSFCAIAFHQGRRIQARSKGSLLREAESLTHEKDFKGYIHDVGGPTANFRHDACAAQKERGACPDKDCLGTRPCPAVRVSHSEYLDILRDMRRIPGIKKVFVRSGIRFDYLMMDSDRTFLRELCEHHISGQLKVAPEHVSDKVLSLMRKSTHQIYENFAEEYKRTNESLKKRQYLVPYYIAGHPGAGLAEALETAVYLKKTGFVPEQVQDFYPTPGTLATCMYYTGLNPHEREADGSMKTVYVARGANERRLQRALLQFNQAQNKPLVIRALKKLGRMDMMAVLYPRK